MLLNLDNIPNASREELGVGIKLLAAAAKGRDLSAGEQAIWDAANSRYDALRVAETGHIGRGDYDPRKSSTSGFHGNNSRDPSTIDKAVAGARAAHGAGIPRDEFAAAESLGLDPRGAFALPLPCGRPMPGRNLSFGAALGTNGSAGGYLIPQGFVANLEHQLKLFAPMLQVAEVWTTPDGRETPWPTLDDVSNTGSQLGENNAASETSLTFGAVIFRSYKFTSGMLRAPSELLRDSPLNIASEIGRAFGERLGRILNTRATTGSGAATITGLITASPTGITTGSATSITMDELIRLQHSVDPAYRAGGMASWMMSPTVASYIRRLKDGNGQYLWQDSVIAGQPATLLGDVVHLNTDMSATITSGDKTVAYGALGKYKLRIVGGAGTDSGGIRMRTLVERYAEYDQTGFMAFLEADGNLLKASSTDSLCPVRLLVQA